MVGPRQAAEVGRSVPAADGGRYGVEFGKVGRRQPDVGGARVVSQVLRGLGTGDGNNMQALSHEPGEGGLGRGGTDAVGGCTDLVRRVEVGLQVVLLEPRQTAPLVLLRKFVEGGEAAGGEAMATVPAYAVVAVVG
ncbi:hypothetical protein MBT84_02995 [Streptomyces sp. MBT84]|nr:hypothetical protein [Streptomyces sp. MBT84]